MYSHKLAIAVKSSGKVLRENGDTVYLPFGSEYSLLIKNLNSVRARVNIEIDGVDIAEGSGFILQPNSSIDIERFIRHGNMSAGNRFKFIERTASVENHRGGIKLDDGLIRVSFEFERENAPRINHYDVYLPKYVAPKSPPPYWYGPWYGSTAGTFGDNSQSFSAYNAEVKCSSATPRARGIDKSGSVSGQATDQFVNNASASLDSGVHEYVEQEMGRAVMDNYFDEPRIMTANVAGVTAPGSISNQTFTTVSDISGDGVQRSMVIKLLGEIGVKKVKKPITVSVKPKCTSCGRTNKATSKFCVECGTGLELV